MIKSSEKKSDEVVKDNDRLVAYAEQVYVALKGGICPNCDNPFVGGHCDTCGG